MKKFIFTLISVLFFVCFLVGCDTECCEGLCSQSIANSNKKTQKLKTTVQFNANGGTGTMVNQVFEQGVQQKLTKCTFTKPADAVSFKYWNTKSDGTGTTYQDEESLTITADTTLYAIWKSNGKILGERPAGSKKQGEKQIESYTDATGDVKIDGTVIPFTSEIVIVPAGCVATVTMEDDSSWGSYYIEDDNFKDSMKGVFVKDRKVKLDAFVMEQYEVTEALYAAVMGLTLSTSNKPMVNITWYQACAFCNEYTQKVNGDDMQCVYYSNPELTKVYTKDDADNELQLYPAYDSTNCKWLKTGYRLPTEAEWEYAARGGNPNSEKWKYAYAGVQSSYCLEEFFNHEEDDALYEYACYNIINYLLVKEVGTLIPNSLNLYDMSGNVSEYVFDRLTNEEGWYQCFDPATKNDSIYLKDGYVSNPFGVTGDNHIFRGGCVSDEQAWYCSVSIRCAFESDSIDPATGFRVCRSIK